MFSLTYFPGFSQTFDGHLCPSDEYDDGVTLELNPTSSSTCEITDIYGIVDVASQTFFMGLEHGNGGQSTFRIYINKDCDNTTGMLVDFRRGNSGPTEPVGGAECLLEFNTGNNNSVSFFEWNGSAMVSSNATTVTRLLGVVATNTDCNNPNGQGNFIELQVPLTGIFDVCDPNGCNAIEVTAILTNAGNNTNSQFCQPNEFSLEVPVNTPPEAIVVPVPPCIYSDEEVCLDGSQSSDPDGDMLTYCWTFDLANTGFRTEAANNCDATTPIAKNMYAPGSYTAALIVYDEFGCADTSLTGTVDFVVLDAADRIECSVINVVEPCSNVLPLEGSFEVSVAGGAMPFMYNLVGGTPQPSNMFTVAAPGSYMVVVVDDNGCTDTCEVDLAVLTAPTVTIEQVCNGMAQTISATTTGTITNYAWTVPGGVAAPGNVASFVVNPAVIGTYSVIVTDIAECTEMATFENPGCCMFEATCPQVLDLGTFACADVGTVPDCPADLAALQAAPYSIVLGTTPCGAILFTCVDDMLGSFCTEQTINRTITIFDDTGDGMGGAPNGILDVDEDSEICVFTYTILAAPGPTIDCSALGGEIECATEAVAGTPVVTTSCTLTGTLSVTGPVIVGTPDCPGTTYTFTHTVTDDCGRTASCDEVFTIANDDPTIDCSALGGEIECATEAVAGTPVVTTSCTLTGTLSVTGPVIVGTPDCPGTTYTFTHTVTDDCGRTASCDEVFTIANDDPTIDCSALGGEIECATEAVAGTPAVTTSCTLTGTLSVTGPVIVGTPDCPGTTYTFTHTVTDDCGRTASCDEVFTIANDDPTIDCSALGGEIECATEAVAGTPAVTTSCTLTGTLSVTGPVIVGTPDCPGTTYTFTHTVTDDCGRTASCDEVFTIANDDPTIDCSALGGEIECATEAVAGTPAVTTSCTLTGTLSVTGPVIVGTSDCPGTTYTFTHTVTDDCGRTASCDEVFTIANDDPTIDCSALGGEIECATEAVAGTPVVTTSCTLTGTLSVTGPVIVGTPDCPGTTYTFTHTVTDDCGRTASCDEVFTIANDDPTIDCSALGGEIECATEAVAGTPAVTTSCTLTGTLSVTGPVIVGTPDCPGTTYTFTHTVTDDCGRTASCDEVFTIANDDPTIDCSALGGEIECATEAVAGTPAVTTSCTLTGTLSVTGPVIVGDEDCDGTTYTFTHTVTDDCGRTASCDEVFTIVNDGPTIDCTALPTTAECEADVAPGTPTFTTSCDLGGTLSVSGPVVGGTAGCDGTTYTYTHTVTDDCGRTASCDQVIAVGNTGPTIDCSALGGTIECATAAVAGTPTYITSCGLGGTLSVTGPVIAGDADCPGTTYTFTHTVTDDCGRTASCDEVYIIANDDPALDCTQAQNLVLKCEEDFQSEIEAWLDATIAALEGTATTSCDLGVVVTHDYDGSIPEFSCDLASGVVVNFTGTDDCGRTAVCSATLFLIDDIAPFWTSGLPGNIEVDCDTDIDDVPWPELTADDECSEVTISRSSAPAFASCGGQAFVRTFTARDACGNSISTSYRISFVDDTPPTLLFVPADTTLSCDAPVPPDSVEATDDCSAVNLSYSEERVSVGDCEDEFDLIRTWRAVDGCGNVTIAMQTISFRDLLAPEINLTPEMAAMVNEDGNIIMYGFDFPQMPLTGAVVTDDCCFDPNDLITFDRLVARNVCDVFGFHTRYRCGYKYTDAAGHSTVLAFDVFQYDTTAPVIMNMPLDMDIGCNALLPPADTNAVFAEDNSGRVPEGSYTENTIVNPSDPMQRQIIRTWSFIDDCGNRSSSTQTITVCDFELTTDVFSRIGNTVWIDKNANGVQESDETGLNGVRVDLYINHNPDSVGSLVGSTWTASIDESKGQYSFDYLLDGSYALRFETPEGYSLTSADVDENNMDQRDSDANQETGMVLDISLRNGSIVNDVDVGFVPEPGTEDPEESEEEEVEVVSGEGGIKAEENQGERTLLYGKRDQKRDLTDSGQEIVSRDFSPISIFPNPTSGRGIMEINIEDRGQAIMLIRDNYGKLIQKMDLQLESGSNQIQFDLSNVASGMYILQLIQDDTIKVRTIIKD